MRLPVRPRLRQTLEVFEASDGLTYLLRGGPAMDVVLETTELARALLPALDGTRNLEQLASELADARGLNAQTIRGCVQELAAEGLLEDGADDDTLPPATRELYDRQLRYFRDLSPTGRAAATHHRVEQAQVAVVGVGGLGSWAALALASAGVGTLIVIDGDVVERGNLHRQVLYRPSDIGRPKADAAAMRS